MRRERPAQSTTGWRRAICDSDAYGLPVCRVLTAAVSTPLHKDMCPEHCALSACSLDLSCLQLLDDPNASKIFPKDALVRAREYLDAIGSTGAYTESQGAAIFRDQIAKVPIRGRLFFSRGHAMCQLPNCAEDVPFLPRCQI